MDNFKKITERLKVMARSQPLHKNDDGKITNREFKYILTHVGENTFSEEEVEGLFKDCGLKEEDELEYEDFVLLWRKHMKSQE